MKFALLLFFLLFSPTSRAQLSTPTELQDIAARSWVLYDHTGDRVLLESDGDARMEPASLTKLMTAYLAFDAIRHDTLSLTQQLFVPTTAVRDNVRESRMLLKVGQSVTVDELLHGLIVQSGSDAAITLAVNIAGSVAGFVDMMNREAKRLGMTNTHFTSPDGLPEAQHYTTARDLALLAAAIVRDYPQQYALFSRRDYTFNNVTQSNSNRLLWMDPYADGMKTGYTESAGYCIVASANRNGHRLIAVLFGVKTDRLRAAESQRLLNYGYQNFDAVRLYAKNQPVATMRIWKGTQDQVTLGFRHDVYIALPKGSLDQLKAKLETRQPIFAPVSGGEQRGVLKLALGDEPYGEFPVVALEGVALSNVFSRGWDSIRLLFE
jgi:D-alanyl-D-alanine carboxypeptidase (penicillin-binding protein 5/6)